MTDMSSITINIHKPLILSYKATTNNPNEINQDLVNTTSTFFLKTKVKRN